MARWSVFFWDHGYCSAVILTILVLFLYKTRQHTWSISVIMTRLAFAFKDKGPNGGEMILHWCCRHLQLLPRIYIMASARASQGFCYKLLAMPISQMIYAHLKLICAFSKMHVQFYFLVFVFLNCLDRRWIYSTSARVEGVKAWRTRGIITQINLLHYS
jgi:hypothetical protein